MDRDAHIFWNRSFPFRTPHMNRVARCSQTLSNPARVVANATRFRRIFSRNQVPFRQDLPTLSSEFQVDEPIVAKRIALAGEGHWLESQFVQ